MFLKIIAQIVHDLDYIVCFFNREKKLFVEKALLIDNYESS